MANIPGAEIPSIKLNDGTTIPMVRGSALSFPSSLTNCTRSLVTAVSVFLLAEQFDPLTSAISWHCLVQELR